MKTTKPSAEERRRQAVEAARAKADKVKSIQEQVSMQTTEFNQTFRPTPLFKNGFVRR